MKVECKGCELKGCVILTKYYASWCNELVGSEMDEMKRISFVAATRFVFVKSI